MRREPEGDRVRPHVGSALISAANYAECICKLIDYGSTPEVAEQVVGSLSLTIEPVTDRHALLAAGIHEQAGRKGLSLGDRLCLALAKEQSLCVLTADRVWADFTLGIDIELIR